VVSYRSCMVLLVALGVALLIAVLGRAFKSVWQRFYPKVIDGGTLPHASARLAAPMVPLLISTFAHQGVASRGNVARNTGWMVPLNFESESARCRARIEARESLAQLPLQKDASRQLLAAPASPARASLA
jgi:hypothetical protein